MFLFVFVGTKRSSEIAKFQCFDTSQLRGCYIQPKKVPERAGESGVFLYLFYCAKSGL